jgi:hypothetical protein
MIKNKGKNMSKVKDMGVINQRKDNKEKGSKNSAKHKNE